MLYSNDNVFEVHLGSVKSLASAWVDTAHPCQYTVLELLEAFSCITLSAQMLRFECFFLC